MLIPNLFWLIVCIIVKNSANVFFMRIKNKVKIKTVFGYQTIK